MRVAVIGGGAAGCMAAAVCAGAGASVTVFERNEKPLKKMFITGKGRCNLTNYCDSREFLKSVVTNPKFLYSALGEFDSYDAFALFESLGVPLKVERGNRVFPMSDRSGDVTTALLKYARKNGAKFILNAKVSEISSKAEEFLICADGEYTFDRVIIATGGASYPATGSTGDGYAFAEKLGHTVKRPVAALSAIDVREDVSALAGLSLKNVRLTCRENGKTLFCDLGEMLFTHTGISGPLTLSLSSYINRKQPAALSVTIDLKPALDRETLNTRILRDFSETLNRDFANSLNALLPKSLIPFVVRLSGIDAGKKVNCVTRAERDRLAELLKGLPLSPVALAPIEQAIVTSGGVVTSEIDPKTMRSKKLAGLYFAGEIIDVDALTGGYNLQIALSTGYAAGKSAAQAEVA